MDFKTYTCCIDGRTESAPASAEDVRAIRADLKAAGLQSFDFVKVYADGSGRGWDEWPNHNEQKIKAGTFRGELRPHPFAATAIHDEEINAAIRAVQEITD